MPLYDEAGIASVMFVSTLDLTGEVAVDRLTGDGEFIARAAIGYDDVEGTTYSAFVALSPLTGYADIPGYELVFNITAADAGGDVMAYWDGADTQHLLIEPYLRAEVRSLICTLVDMLIDDVEPPLVSMVTQVAHLPPAALTKYHQICAIFAGKGYRAGKSNSWNGQHTWMMERA
ncbi:hypothetical protein [uncultured Sphingomonas sp.]|uniref:hypothetical protein n=1 Tax=uncultured Sphingomonas sp. TaxID=158754 RepID=UPI0025CC3B76|nr:hypothetical protein [uncultured Sphingomonas sp.]